MGDPIDERGQARPLVPPVLYLPCKAGSTTDLAMIEMRELEDGRVALMAYTSLDRLARCCGDQQPWVLFKTESLGELRRDSPYDVVVLDQALPVDLRHGASG
jgi:hypothetical protein